MSEQNIQQKVAAFLSRHTHEAELGGDDDIFAMGFVNSLFAMQIVLFVEKEFGITVENEDLEPDNFRSVNAIVRFVSRKLAAPAEPSASL